MNKTIDSLISSSMRLRPRDRTPGKGSTMPAPWSPNSGQDARLASAFEPQDDRRAGPRYTIRVRSVQTFPKKARPDSISHDRNIANARVRTPPTLTVARFVAAKKAPEWQHHDFPSLFWVKKKKKKTASTCYPNNHDVKVPPARHNRCPTPEFNTHTHTTNYSIKVKGRGGKGKKTYFLPPSKPSPPLLFLLFFENSHIQRLA